MQLEVSALEGLADLAGAHGLGRARHEGAHRLRGHIGRQLQRLGKETIAGEHGNFVAPIGRERGPAAANLGAVHHIIVHQRSEVDHLNNHRRARVLGIEPARCATAQGHQQRSQLFALAAQRVLHEGGDLRIKGIHLRLQLARHLIEEWLHRFAQLLPVQRRRGVGLFGEHLGKNIAREESGVEGMVCGWLRDEGENQV